MVQTDEVITATGSIADVSARLALWAKRAPKGLARVEFVSDFSRREAVIALRGALSQHKPFHEIALPFQQPAIEVVHFLREHLRELSPGVVSVTGFATAFSDDVPLVDSLRVLNFHRENLTQYSFCQVWWMTSPFAETFLRSVPDLDSWFMQRLNLTEAIRDASIEAPLFQEADSNLTDPNEARKQSAEYVKRFENALKSKSPIGALTHLAVAAISFLHNAGLEIEEKQLAILLLNEMDHLIVESGLSKIQIEPDSWNVKWDFATRSTYSALPQDLRLLAQIYERAGIVDRAEMLYILSLKMTDNIVWQEFHGIEASFESLADFYIRQQRYLDAELLCTDWIAKNEYTASKDGIPTLPTLKIMIALDHLLRVRLLQEKYTEAEQIYYQMLRISQSAEFQYLGLDISLLNNLSLLYKRLGRYHEAKALAMRVAKIQEKK